MILRKETEVLLVNIIHFLSLIRMNDTPQGDGSISIAIVVYIFLIKKIRMNDTPQGDGSLIFFTFNILYLHKDKNE